MKGSKLKEKQILAEKNTIQKNTTSIKPPNVNDNTSQASTLIPWSPPFYSYTQSKYISAVTRTSF